MGPGLVTHHQLRRYSDAGGNCVGTVPASSQYAFFFDINISSWTEVNLGAVHNFLGLDACGNVVIAYSDNIVIGYSSITSTWDTISYSGAALSPTQNGLHRSWGCSENLAYFVTDAEYFVFDGDLGSWQSLAITMPATFYGVGFFWAEEDYCGVVLNVSVPDHNKNLMYSLHTHSFNQIDQGGDYNHDYSGMTHGFVAKYTSGTDNNLYGYSAHNNTVTEITINGHIIYGSNDRGSADKMTEKTVATFGYNVVNSPTSRTAYMKGYDTRTGTWTEDNLNFDPTDWYGITSWTNGGTFSVASNSNYTTGHTYIVIYNGLNGEFVTKSLSLTSFQGYVIGGTVFAATDDDSIFFYSLEGDTSQTVPRRWQSSQWYPADNYFVMYTYDSSVSDSMDLYIYHGPNNNANHTTTWRTGQIYSTPYFCAFATGGPGNHSYFYSGILDNLSSFSFPAGTTPGFYPNEKMLQIHATDLTVTYNAETEILIDKPYTLGGVPGKNAVLARNGSFDMEAYSAETGNWSTFTIDQYLQGCTTNNLVGLAECMDGPTWSHRFYAYNGYSNNIVFLDPVGNQVNLYPQRVGDETIIVVRDTTIYAFDPFGVNSVEENDTKLMPEKYHLSQNYPNPFNPITNIQFSIPKTGFVTLKIYNLLGQEVDILVSEKMDSGTHKSIWNASELASCVYFYKLQAGSFVQTRKLILMK
jgi:hypothetical protein